MTNQKNNNKYSIKKIILLSISLALLISIGASFLSWYLPLDPKSPPSTRLGAEPKFDALFENNKWLFVFAQNNKIIETDIYGKSERVVLDIVEATKNTQSELLYDFSISPDGRYLAANYYSERNANGPPIGKILIVEIKSGKITFIPTVLEGYIFQWERPAYWVGSNVFFVSMHRYLSNGSSASKEDEVFSRYDLQDLENTQVIEFDHCGTTKFTKSNPTVLLLSSDCIPTDQAIIQALDVNGKRVASAEEKAFFEKCSLIWSSCERNLATAAMASIKIEGVTGNLLDGFGRWYNNNWYRDYIYLNNEIVRVTDAIVEVEPFWDSDIKMFIWVEVDKTYQMDIDGHYRFWHNGDYIGKIPNQ